MRWIEILTFQWWIDEQVSRVDWRDFDTRWDRSCHLVLMWATRCCSSPAASTRLPRANWIYFSFTSSSWWRSDAEWSFWSMASSWAFSCSTSSEEEDAGALLLLLGTAISISLSVVSRWFEISRTLSHCGQSDSRTDRRSAADWQMKPQRRCRDCTPHWTESKSAPSQPCNSIIVKSSQNQN